MNARTLIHLSWILLLLLPAVTDAQLSSSHPSDATTPKLVVFITIDAMRSDYLERFNSQLKGGLALLYHGGAVFTNGFHDHGITETAPGHASLLSGRFPVHTGISMNTAGVNDPAQFMIDSGDSAASPFRFKGTTLIDWLAAKDPRTKVLSMSRKDRGAILTVGRSKREVYWFTHNGLFSTSTYYADTLPTWVQQFNARKLPMSYAGKKWETLLPSSEYSEPDSVPLEDAGSSFLFPHILPNDTVNAAQYLPSYPWMDDLTLQLALNGISALSLGAGPETDILAVSLSTTDAVGHRYGPDSRETHDQILRLDRYLGTFFDSLFKMRNRNDVVIALTADHGLTPFPEVHAHDPNANARRVSWSPAVIAFRSDLAKRGVGSSAFRVEDGALTLDREELKRAHINADSLVTAFRTAVLKIPGVLRADRITDLQKQDTTRDVVARRWLHMFDEKSGVELVITAEPYDYVRANTQAQHGTPYDIDAHVPIIFYGAPFRAGSYSEFVRTVDMAPTLAAVLRVKPLEKLDGRPLTRAIR